MDDGGRPGDPAGPEAASALPRPGVRDVLLLHLLILFHSGVGVVAKLVSRHTFLSAPFVRLYLVELAMIAVYAFFWQKVLKRFELSVAFANTGMYIVWTLVWAALFFREHVGWNHLAGAGVVIAGIAVLFSRWN